jgi:hypothetical protein
MDLCTYHRIHANSAKSIKVAKQVYSADLPGFAALKPKKSGRTQQRATAWGNTNYGRKNHNRTLFDYQCYKFTTGDHGAAQRQKGLAEAVDEKAEQRRRVYAAFKEADEKEAREKSEVDQVKNERKQRLKKKFHKRACFEEKQKQKQREKDEKHFRKIVDGWLGPGERNVLDRKKHREKKEEIKKRREFLLKKAQASGASFDPEELLRQTVKWKEAFQKAQDNRAYQTPGTPRGHINPSQLRFAFKNITCCLVSGEHVLWCMQTFGKGGYINWDGFLEFNENRFAKVKVYVPPVLVSDESAGARDRFVAGASAFEARLKTIADANLKRDEDRIGRRELRLMTEEDEESFLVRRAERIEIQSELRRQQHRAEARKRELRDMAEEEVWTIMAKDYQIRRAKNADRKRRAYQKDLEARKKREAEKEALEARYEIFRQRSVEFKKLRDAQDLRVVATVEADAWISKTRSEEEEVLYQWEVAEAVHSAAFIAREASSHALFTLVEAHTTIRHMHARIAAAKETERRKVRMARAKALEAEVTEEELLRRQHAEMSAMALEEHRIRVLLYKEASLRAKLLGVMKSAVAIAFRAVNEVQEPIAIVEHYIEMERQEKEKLRVTEEEARKAEIYQEMLREEELKAYEDQTLRDRRKAAQDKAKEKKLEQAKERERRAYAEEQRALQRARTEKMRQVRRAVESAGMEQAMNEAW